MRTVAQIISEVRRMQEAAYAGNLGVVEMFQFMQQASAQDIQRMEDLLAAGEYDAVWRLLRTATGVPLKRFEKDRKARD